MRLNNNNNMMLFLLSAFLWNFFLRQDQLSDDVPPPLGQPCCEALGRTLDSGLVSSCRQCQMNVKLDCQMAQTWWLRKLMIEWI